MTTAAAAISQTMPATQVKQKVSSEILPQGVLCRLTLANEGAIRENANLFNASHKAAPVYFLPTETAEKVFNMTLSKAFPSILIRLPGSQDTDAGKITDQLQFFDVVEENKQKIKEVLESTQRLYHVWAIWHAVSEEYKKAYSERTHTDARSITLIEDHPDLLEQRNKLREAANKGWEAFNQYYDVANKHRIWSDHFQITMHNHLGL